MTDDPTTVSTSTEQPAKTPEQQFLAALAEREGPNNSTIAQLTRRMIEVPSVEAPDPAEAAYAEALRIAAARR